MGLVVCIRLSSFLGLFSGMVLMSFGIFFGADCVSRVSSGDPHGDGGPLGALCDCAGWETAGEMMRLHGVRMGGCGGIGHAYNDGLTRNVCSLHTLYRGPINLRDFVSLSRFDGPFLAVNATVWWCASMDTNG